MVHLGQHLRDAEAGRIHGQHEVLLVEIRQHRHRVHAGGVLLAQHGLVRAVRADHPRRGVALGKRARLLPVALDDLDVRARLQQARREVFRDAPRADQHDVGGLLLIVADRAEHVDEVRRRRAEIDVVARAHPEVAVRDDDLVPARDRADQHLAAQLLRQLGQREAVQELPGPGDDLDDLDAVVGKGVALQHARDLQQAEHLVSGVLLRVDGHGEAQLVAQQVELIGVVRRADAGDRAPAAEPLGKHAAQQVQLVLRRAGDHDVAVLHVRLPHRSGGRAVAADRHAVQRVADVLHHVAVGVHDRDVVPLRRELAGDRAADLAAADDDNLHARFPPGSICRDSLYFTTFPPEKQWGVFRTRVPGFWSNYALTSATAACKI